VIPKSAVGQARPWPQVENRFAAGRRAQVGPDQAGQSLPKNAALPGGPNDCDKDLMVLRRLAELQGVEAASLNSVTELMQQLALPADREQILPHPQGPAQRRSF